MVEQLVAMAQRVATKRKGKDSDEDEMDGDREGDENAESNYRILPYRAGYEEEDRTEIQTALSKGYLAGVVSTSALELGIDIGEIDVVVCLGLPPSMKAFWQRIGRAGRKNPATCLLIDDQGFVEEVGGLEKYLLRPLEPNWLYLQNRYIQYSHVLCAAFELTGRAPSKEQLSPFNSLPDTFRELVDNELQPREPVPQDLYELKQRAQGGPHQEFPLRSAVEPNFRVIGPHDAPMGELSYQYALREAYPGAIYYYMARPYRAYSFNYRQREIRLKREKRWTTRATSRVTVFPKLPDGILTSMRSNGSSLAEVDLQVSEEVMGFEEQHGPISEKHNYGPVSPYSQKSLSRFFRTTGVCLYFPEITLSRDAIYLVVEAFCTEYSVQRRELGIGDFYSKINFAGMREPVRGSCVYDATNGSLRLTQELAENFLASVSVACDLAQRRGEPFALQLGMLLESARTLKVEKMTPSQNRTPEGDWIEVIATGEMGMYSGDSGRREQVEVLGVRYTRGGPVYDIRSATPGVSQYLGIQTVQPIFGTTKTVLWNPDTGEFKEP
jgi:DEAD/DEAH box helicase domain-containing protein